MSALREAALIPRPAKSSWVRRFLGSQGSRPGEGHCCCGRRGVNVAIGVVVALNSLRPPL